MQGCPNGRNSHFFANQKSIFANEIFAKSSLGESVNWVLLLDPPVLVLKTKIWTPLTCSE